MHSFVTVAVPFDAAHLAAVEQALNAIGNQAIGLSATVNPILSASSSLVDPQFAGLSSNIASQLHQVAKIIAVRQATGAARQIFFVQLRSFDTHNDQLNRQQALFAGVGLAALMMSSSMPSSGSVACRICAGTVIFLSNIRWLPMIFWNSAGSV